MHHYKIEAGTAQHIGNRAQQNNRSAVLAGVRAPGYLMAVLADGVAGGATAAEQALHTAKHLFDAFTPGPQAQAGAQAGSGVADLAALLRAIIHEAHLVITMNGVATGSEPHASVAALIISPTGLAVWAHTGDTRLYRFELGICKARTSDAAYIDHLVEGERLPAESARNHRHATLLVNVLGNSRKAPFVTIGSHAGLAAGDAFLLCSDGLWHFFTDAELGAAVHKHAPRQASELLINKAGERALGGGGNCSMAIIKLVRPAREVPDYTVQQMGRAV